MDLFESIVVRVVLWEEEEGCVMGSCLGGGRVVDDGVGGGEGMGVVGEEG